MLWFMVVVLLQTPDGEYVTVAKEVDSRIECEMFAEWVESRFQRSYLSFTCKRYKIDDRDSDSETDQRARSAD